MRRALAERVKRPPRSAGRKRQVFPRYVAIGNAKRVDRSVILIPGRVYADYDAAGELIGIAILG